MTKAARYCSITTVLSTANKIKLI